jgi:hypothetical protein
VQLWSDFHYLGADPCLTPSSHTRGKTVDQAFCLADIGDLAGREDEADGVAEGGEGNAYLRSQTVARTPDRLIFDRRCMLVRPHNGGIDGYFGVRMFCLAR